MDWRGLYAVVPSWRVGRYYISIILCNRHIISIFVHNIFPGTLWRGLLRPYRSFLRYNMSKYNMYDIGRTVRM